ncbi:TetR/AcrR family transcriptional regulator [Kribbella sp. NPDC026611]|uniref:TetR/AcrR family transcriptional regulator n=1 Tax=Kribbella sp. NPDC026611 TaxID=3154911 RepID=UPI0033D9F816
MTSTTPTAGRPNPARGAEQVPPKRRRDRAAREREMLEAAERIFGERGYHGTSMDDVAAQVGVSKPLIYQYYGSKDGLFLAVLGRLRTQLLDTVADAVMAATDAEDALYAGFVAWFQFLDDHPQAWSVLIDEGMLNAGAEATEEVRAAFIDLIATMVRRNLPAGRPADDDEVQIVAQSISGATERLAIWRTRTPHPPTPEKVAQTLQNLLWQGLHTLSTNP